MELGLQSAAPAAETRPGKRAAVGSTESDVKKALSLVAKLALSNAQYSRLMRALLLDVWRFEAESRQVAEVKAAQKAYHEASERFRDPSERLESIGLPHIHAWNGLVKQILEFLKDQPEPQAKELFGKVQSYVTSYTAKGWKAIAEQVRVVRLKKTYDRQFMNLEVHIMEGSDSDQIYAIMKEVWIRAKSARRLEGVPAPGDLEREIQKWLGSNGFSEARAVP